MVQQLVGGANRSREEEALKKNKPAIVLGTPGRIAEISAAGKLHTHSCRFLVLNEVDELLSFNFQEDMHRILEHVGRRSGGDPNKGRHPQARKIERRTIMVSATVPFYVIRAFSGIPWRRMREGVFDVIYGGFPVRPPLLWKIHPDFDVAVGRVVRVCKRKKDRDFLGWTNALGPLDIVGPVLQRQRGRCGQRVVVVVLVVVVLVVVVFVEWSSSSSSRERESGGGAMGKRERCGDDGGGDEIRRKEEEDDRSIAREEEEQRRAHSIDLSTWICDGFGTIWAVHFLSIQRIKSRVWNEVINEVIITPPLDK
ncbi:hypothetical protein Droror1_Dr00023788 [Drosera rotundifolia]